MGKTLPPGRTGRWGGEVKWPGALRVRATNGPHETVGDESVGVRGGGTSRDGFDEEAAR